MFLRKNKMLGPETQIFKEKHNIFQEMYVKAQDFKKKQVLCVKNTKFLRNNPSFLKKTQ